MEEDVTVSRTTLEDAMDVLRALVRDLWPGDKPISFSMRLASGNRVCLPFPTTPSVSKNYSIDADRMELIWFGTRYDLTTHQIEPVRLLVEAFEGGVRDVPNKTLIDASETVAANPSVRDIFKLSALLPAGVLVPGRRRGSWRLLSPDEVDE
jgi:hypothetical protein